MPLWWQGPLWDSGAEDSLEQSVLWEGVCCHGGTALHPLCWAWGRGCAYQALADPPCLQGLGQMHQLLPLQEPASAAEGFLGGLANSRDATTAARGTGPCVPHLGRAQSLSLAVQGRHTSWGLMLPPGSAPQGKIRAATLSGWKPVRASTFWASVTPDCCGAVAQSLGMQAPMPGAAQRELAGKGTHLPIHLGSRRRKAAVGREAGSAWS